MSKYVKAAAFGFCGLAAFSVDQFMNYEFMSGLEGGITSLVYAVPVAGLLCAVSWGSIWKTLRKGDLPNTVSLMAVFALLAAFTLGASVYRASEAYDTKVARTASENMPVTIAVATVTSAKADWIEKDRAMQTELAKGGCGRICRDRKILAAEALQRWNASKTALAGLGVLYER